MMTTMFILVKLEDIVVPAEEDTPKVVAAGGAAKKVNETSRL